MYLGPTIGILMFRVWCKLTIHTRHQSFATLKGQKGHRPHFWRRGLSRGLEVGGAKRGETRDKPKVVDSRLDAKRVPIFVDSRLDAKISNKKLMCHAVVSQSVCQSRCTRN